MQSLAHTSRPNVRAAPCGARNQAKLIRPVLIPVEHCFRPIVASRRWRAGRQQPALVCWAQEEGKQQADVPPPSDDPEENFDLLSTKVAELTKELNNELRGCSIYLVGMMGSGKSTVSAMGACKHDVEGARRIKLHAALLLLWQHGSEWPSALNQHPCKRTSPPSHCTHCTTTATPHARTQHAHTYTHTISNAGGQDACQHAEVRVLRHRPHGGDGAREEAGVRHLQGVWRGVL